MAVMTAVDDVEGEAVLFQGSKLERQKSICGDVLGSLFQLRRRQAVLGLVDGTRTFRITSVTHKDEIQWLAEFQAVTFNIVSTQEYMTCQVENEAECSASSRTQTSIWGCLLYTSPSPRDRG